MRAAVVVIAAIVVVTKSSLVIRVTVVAAVVAAQAVPVQVGAAHVAARAGHKYIQLGGVAMDLTVDELLPFCEQCGGTGKMENPVLKQNEGSSYGTRVTYASPVDCDGCNGRGVIPTKAGETLLEFLQRAKAKRLL